MKALILTILLLPAAAPAQPADCQAPPGWDGTGTVMSATHAAELDSARLVPGQAATVILHSQRDVRYAAAPGQAPGLDSRSGMVSVTIPAPGTWRVALGAGAWVDLLEDGKPVASSAHGHGCGTARKIVAFPLKAGPHVLQITSDAATAMRVMVMP